jgi:uncharacterized protein YjiS (DUF1127 family)
MATFDTNRTKANGHLQAGVFGGVFAALITLVADWMERRSTRSALLQLSDRELDDIGLTRGDIERTL